jgi:hypothetical protein
MYPTKPLAQKDLLTVKTLEPQYSYVSSAVGGSLSQVSLGEHMRKSRVVATYSRGLRRKIRGFPKASRRNLLSRMASINRTVFRAYKGRVISLGLTYPSEYPEDPKLCKRHLEALRKRLTRMYGPFFAFWRMGI